MEFFDEYVVGCQADAEGVGDGHTYSCSEVYAEAADACADIVVTSGYVTEVIVPARIIDACQRENFPFLSNGDGYLCVQVYQQGIGMVVAEHVADVGGKPEAAVEPVGELDSCHGRPVVGGVSGLQPEAFLAGEFIGRCRVEGCRGGTDCQDGGYA